MHNCGIERSWVTAPIFSPPLIAKFWKGEAKAIQRVRPPTFTLTRLPPPLFLYLSLFFRPFYLFQLSFFISLSLSLSLSQSISTVDIRHKVNSRLTTARPFSFFVTCPFCSSNVYFSNLLLSLSLERERTLNIIIGSSFGILLAVSLFPRREKLSRGGVIYTAE